MDGPERNWTPSLKAIAGRRSVRAFLDRAVPLNAIEALLEAAARAPSDNNSKPWKVHVLTGSTKARLTETIMAARAGGTPEPAMEYHYYPVSWPEPFLGRRRQVGWALYDLLGIQKGDRSGSRAWHDRNFDFVGAPVGLIVATDRRLGFGALIDVGMFLDAFAIGPGPSGWKPACRLPSVPFTMPPALCSTFRRKIWSSAAWRWGSRTGRPSRTRFGRPAQP